jgi:hypothetical protein
VTVKQLLQASIKGPPFVEPLIWTHTVYNLPTVVPDVGQLNVPPVNAPLKKEKVGFGWPTSVLNGLQLSRLELYPKVAVSGVGGLAEFGMPEPVTVIVVPGAPCEGLLVIEALGMEA